MPPDGRRDPAARMRTLLLDHRDEILSEWTSRVRESGIPPGLSDTAVIDHLPQILARVARNLEPGHASPKSTALLGEAHALDRLSQGFALDQVVLEYRILRRVITNAWVRLIGDKIEIDEVMALDEALDESIRQAVVQYAASRERILTGLNEVSEVAARATDLDSFLKELLHATVQTLVSVDTAVILVRTDDRLEVRAAIGLEEESEEPFSLAVGEGFAGTIAALREPMAIANASLDPLVLSPAIRRKGVRALYGVPLISQNEVIGVAHIGSLTAREFSEENKLLFRTMASRAASFLAKARLQLELASAARENARLYNESKEAVAIRDMLLSVVSHDLRNELSAVVNVSTLLNNEGVILDPERREKVVKAIQRSGASMKRLVSDLLDSAAIRSGTLSMSLAPVDLAPILEEALTLHDASAKERGIELRIGEVPPVRVLVDHERLLQVLGNLLGNGLKYIASGDSMVMSAEVAGPEAVVRVKDSGPGIDPAEMARITNAYESLASRSAAGGLGLFIARRIIEKHGGRFWIESKPGDGTSIYFSVPLARE